ncbi:VOC family protein [Marinomonas piezotolerans]|uniref:VOC family protein n=1 Tax=Marinomonas piezotolerans TaxID=2213058 RepID=A0A370U867_9GAMM|nr:VOC family protein [Marinomonas piezotolerans]RDL43967.1 VOC family protein [Marinomonas piezotolerans]
MISRFNHIVLTVSDVEQSVAFYQRALHMVPGVLEDGQRFISFGTQSIYLQTLGQEMRHHPLEGAGNICLVSDWALEEVVEHLTSENIKLLAEPTTKTTPQGVMQSVYFNDLDNNLVEVAVYHQ